MRNGNYLIAAFVGLERNVYGYYVLPELMAETNESMKNVFGSNKYEEYQLQFDRNSEWQLIAIEKIESLGFRTSIMCVFPKTDADQNGLHTMIIANDEKGIYPLAEKETRMIQQTKKGAMWTGILTFVEWYNLQPLLKIHRERKLTRGQNI